LTPLDSASGALVPAFTVGSPGAERLGESLAVPLSPGHPEGSVREELRLSVVGLGEASEEPAGRLDHGQSGSAGASPSPSEPRCEERGETLVGDPPGSEGPEATE
jgi:hypothetical protein